MLGGITWLVAVELTMRLVEGEDDNLAEILGGVIGGLGAVVILLAIALLWYHTRYGFPFIALFMRVVGRCR